MKKNLYSVLLTTGLITLLSTQVFAETATDLPMLISSENVESTYSTSVVITEVEPTNFTGIMPKKVFEVRYSDTEGNSSLIETVMVFEKTSYNSMTKIARPTPAIILGNDLYVTMKAENPYVEGTVDYTNFETIADENEIYIDNQITDLSMVNNAFEKLFGTELNEDFLSQFIFVQDLTTDKMTTLKFNMYAPINEDKTEYDLLGIFTLDIKGDATVKVPMKQDVAVDPSFAFAQKILMNHQVIAELGVVTNGYIYLPVRAYADLANYSVVYDSKSDSVTLTRGNVQYHTTYGSDEVTKTVNGDKVTYINDNPLYRVDGVGYVPIDFLINGINN